MAYTTDLHISLPNLVPPGRRSKRKGIPVRSPSRLNLDTSPGIIFKFPMYFPPHPTDSSPLSPAESTCSSSSSVEEEIVERSDCSIILHYPMLLSHVARKRRARSLDLVATEGPKTRTSPSSTSRQRRSSAQWAQNSALGSIALEETAHHQNESDSPDHSSSNQPSAKKCCTSCGVKHTPCWRPGWSEDTPLCNSCGLRYRKTKVYCQSCLYIPLRSELSGNITCPKCKELL